MFEELVKRAIAEKLTLNIQYTSRRDETMDRLVIPVEFIERHYDCCYFKAWCLNRYAYRTFRLDQVSQLSIVEGVTNAIPSDAAPPTT